jgi:hypothetical protein
MVLTSQASSAAARSSISARLAASASRVPSTAKTLYLPLPSSSILIQPSAWASSIKER